MYNSLKSVAYNTLLQEWAERIKEFRASKLTVKAWCLEHDVKLSTYYTWQKRVFNVFSSKMQASTGSAAPVFAEIVYDTQTSHIENRLNAAYGCG